jgi:large subunit ribosomal protein L21
MYAVFEDGSRQYKVSEGDLVTVDYREAEVGTRLEFKRVLLYGGGDTTHIGRPTIDGARILAEVVGHPSIKLYIQHFRKRKNYRRLRGHRQPYTKVQIRNILLAGMEPSAASPEAPSQPASPSSVTSSGDQTKKIRNPRKNTKEHEKESS